MKRTGPYISVLNFSILAPENEDVCKNYAGHTNHGTNAMRSRCWCGRYGRGRGTWSNLECENLAWKR